MATALLLGHFSKPGSLSLWISSPQGASLDLCSELLSCHPAGGPSAQTDQAAGLPRIFTQESYSTCSERVSPGGTISSRHGDRTQHGIISLLPTCFIGPATPINSRGADGSNTFLILERWCIVFIQKFKSFLTLISRLNRVCLVECWGAISILSVRYFGSFYDP